MQQHTTKLTTRKTSKVLDWEGEAHLNLHKKATKAKPMAIRARAREEAREAGLSYRER